MINHAYNDLFYKGSTDKQWKIKYSNGVIGNDNELFSDSIQLEESLCSDQNLTFGACEASCFKFKVANIFTSLKYEWLDVSIVLGGDESAPFTVGRYKVYSDNVTADRMWRDVVAYDSMYDIINADVSDWYNSILPNDDSTVTMRQFRKSFVEHFGLQEAEISLVNDNMIVKKTISIQSSGEKSDEKIVEETSLTGKEVINSICEINGCFGHIGRDGLFHYIYLAQDIQGLYPADFLFPGHVPEEYDYISQSESGSLYPQSPKGFKIGVKNYIPPCKYEDYHVKGINKVQIRQEENDIGMMYPETEKSENDNCYIIQDNFLVYGKSSAELLLIAKNLYGKIKNLVYRPFSVDCPGNLCLEVGDAVVVSTNSIPVESYILKRSMKGLQALRDSYFSAGDIKMEENKNSIHSSIVQLKGKANTLERSVEETRSTITDVENGLRSQITQTAEKIAAEVTDREEGDRELSGRLEVTATAIAAEVTDREEGDRELSGRLEVTAGQVVLKADANGKIVTAELSADPENGTEFKVDAENISLTAQEAINLLAGGTLNLTGKNIKIESDNFSVDRYGKVIAKSIEIQGGSIRIETANSSETNDIVLKKLTTNAKDSNGDDIDVDLFGEESIMNIMINNSWREEDDGKIYMCVRNGDVARFFKASASSHTESTMISVSNKSQLEIYYREASMSPDDGFTAADLVRGVSGKTNGGSETTVIPGEISLSSYTNKSSGEIDSGSETTVIPGEISLIKTFRTTSGSATDEVIMTPVYTSGHDGLNMEVGLNIDKTVRVPELQFEPLDIKGSITTPSIQAQEKMGQAFLDINASVSANTVEASGLIIGNKQLMSGSIIYDYSVRNWGATAPYEYIDTPGISAEMPAYVCNGDGEAQDINISNVKILPGAEQIKFQMTAPLSGAARFSYYYWREVE